MKISSVLAASVALLIPLAIVGGCGGGGGSATPSGGSGAVSLFATDDMSTAFDHVWINVKQVVLVGAGGDRVVFDDSSGQIFDVKTLRDSTGRRFRLLCNHAIPDGSYTGIRIVVDSKTSVFPTGASTATVATFDGSVGTSKTFALSFGSPKNLGRGSEMIVDFDLSRWTLTGTTVTATDGQFLNVVEDNGVHDPGRHNQDDYPGTVSAISGTAPDQTFTLSHGTSNVIVKTTAGTSVFNSSGAASPTLANGERVEVTGVFSTTDNSLTATTIKIEDDPSHDRENEIRGQITAVSSKDKTVTVSLFRADGFVPTTSMLTIQIGDSTQLFSNRGISLTSEEFFAAATVNGFIEAQGTLNGAVLTAAKAKIEDEGEHHGGGNGGGGHHGKAEVAGTASALDAGAGTFTLSVTRWEGLLLSRGAQVQIATSAGTEFKLNGTHTTSAAFFAALGSATAPNNVLSVEGSYDDTTKVLTATEVKLGSGNGGGGGHGGDD